MTPPSEVPFDYVIEPDERLGYGRMWGTVTGDDMLALITAVHADPRWEHDFDAIWDCSRVHAHIVDIDEVGPLVAEAATSTGRDVLVESPRLTEIALAHLLAAFSRRRGKQMTVTTSVEAALVALGREALPPAAAALHGTAPA